MKLSVVLATYNEEKNLPACLESVAGWCSEIVVIDGSSRDHTIDIAQKFGARVTVTDNPPIFHINKQKAIDLARGEWILQLDADERVSRELKTEIDAAIKNPDIDGYWLPRKNYFLGRFLTKGGQYPDYTLRLYRKGKGRLPLKDVHEQAIVLGEVGYLKNPLIRACHSTLRVSDPERESSQSRMASIPPQWRGRPFYKGGRKEGYSTNPNLFINFSCGFSKISRTKRSNI